MTATLVEAGGSVVAWVGPQVEAPAGAGLETHGHVQARAEGRAATQCARLRCQSAAVENQRQSGSLAWSVQVRVGFRTVAEARAMGEAGAGLAELVLLLGLLH